MSTARVRLWREGCLSARPKAWRSALQAPQSQTYRLGLAFAKRLEKETRRSDNREPQGVFT
jgi:hypothetical protein